MSSKRKAYSLIGHLRKIVIVPLVCLGIIVLIITSYIIYTSMRTETKDGLDNLLHTLYRICQLTGNGDYSMRDGVLLKGGKPFDSKNSIVDDIHRVSGVDATIFWGNTRALTSIRDESGNRAAGTKAAAEVSKKVLEGGKDYFSDQVMVNDVLYFGYYMPLKNSDKTIIGMVFVGKARSVVMQSIIEAILLISFAVLLVMIAAVTIALTYAQKIVSSLNTTKEYLGSIVQGNAGSGIAPELLERKDEIGEMGRFSVTLKKSITHLVGTDALTGLHNRRNGILLLEESLSECRQYHTPLTLAIGDIDNFKSVNDKYGHPAGDLVLKQVSGLFLEHMGRKGFAIRWGGEEFLLIYERMDTENAVMNLEELQEKVRSLPIEYEGDNIDVTMTFGVAEYEDSVSIEELLKKADENLYFGKFEGKDRVVQHHGQKGSH